MLSPLINLRPFLFILCLLFPAYVLATGNSYNLIISKSDQQLKIMQGDKIIKHFYIAHGRGGKGIKQEFGDKKTPVGVYRIVKFKGDSKFHYFMQLDYPNLLDAWNGYKNKTINATEFRRIVQAINNRDMPPQNTKLGGYIGLHGLGNVTRKKLSIHSKLNWTKGCIAMTNEQINELRQYVKLGTKVTIKE